MSAEVDEGKQVVYKEYDPKFSEDISKRMQMPDRLVPGNENEPTTFNYNLRNNQEFKNADFFGDPAYVLSTPPTSIKNFYGTSLADDDDSPSHKMPWKRSPNLMRNMEEEDEKEDGLVMTPGTILLMKDGDNLAALQRQVAKLSRRVSRLQEENNRRNSKDLLIYPLLVTFFLFQIGKYFFSR